MDDDEIIDLEPTPKRVKSGASTNIIASPSKKKRLEEDGLILMDGANDQLRDDVIEID
jgi:ubiquitin-like 1-activating enzyme E1 B